MTDTVTPLSPSPVSRSVTSMVILTVIAALITCLFLGLGTWQVKRLFWKLDLINRVETRAHATPVDAPAPLEWAALPKTDYEYRRVHLSGTFINSAEAQVYASTDLGPGFWIMTPLRQDDGAIVFINRGFVPTDKRNLSTRPQSQIEGHTEVTGLMRIPETGGLFMRDNDPANDRWYQRNVAMLGQDRGLGDVAPYFVDAGETAVQGGLPVGGLTRIVFTNNHLVYAVTWYALAAMTIGAAVYLVRSGRRAA